MPTLEQIVAIAKVQESKEEALAEKYHAQDEKQSIREAEAAGKIQVCLEVSHRAIAFILGVTLNDWGMFPSMISNLVPGEH